MDDHDLDGALQSALSRLTLLNEIATVLSSTLDATEAITRVCRILVPALADWCTADLTDDDGGVRRVCATHRDSKVDLAGITGPLPRPPAAASGPLSRVLRGEGPLLLRGKDLPRAEEAFDPLHKLNLELFARLGGGTLVVAPMRVRGRVFGALTLVRSDERAPLDEADLSLVDDLTHRMALAADNARLHAEAKTTAEHLQRSLLPDLPDVGGLAITGRYTPARSTAQVGGDWYDSFVLPQGDVTMIIGDVTGHDLQAAVTMSQLRNMLRGIACDRREPPGRILRRLDAAIDTLYGHTTATCVYALVKEVGEGRYALDWSQAGHPPPLLITADGDAQYLDAAHEVMLGVVPDVDRPSVRRELPPGGTLLLYTDGLIERRGEVIDHGLTRLRQHAAALVDRELDDFCDELLRLLTPEADDDVALLALRLPGSGAGEDDTGGQA
ncbi:GAF domain-containing SpoIIE family protein phosphatase [Streptantibioticus parmotrematis]|uniref:PP2C family protein-serine/threonine phosphatase n=1 Tax=Streptantibioticus parmotrematis TaxID=2873249 RepID=UPI0033D1B6BD